MNYEQQSQMKMAIVGLVVIALVVGGAIGYHFYSAAKPVTTETGGGRYTKSAPPSGTYTIEVPKEFEMSATKRDVIVEGGEKVEVETYSSSGSTDLLDGFSVVRYRNYLDQKIAGQSLDALLEKLIDRRYADEGCAREKLVNTTNRYGPVKHTEGRGINQITSRKVILAMDVQATAADVYVLTVYAIQAPALGGTEARHFFDSFTLNRAGK